MSRTRLARVFIVSIVLISAVGAPTAVAQEFGFYGWGLRGGFTLDPDQVVGGIHFDLGYLGDRVVFRPNADFGIGDDETVITVNAAFLWQMTKQWGEWQPLLGGEIGVNHRDIDHDRGSDDNETELAVNFVAAIETVRVGGSRLSFEAKAGLIEEPHFKLLVGWTF